MWPDRVGQVTPVHVYTSGDEAELFLNGKSLGRKHKEQYEYRVRWDDVVYPAGGIESCRLHKNGQRWAEDKVETSGPAAGIEMQADRANIAGDGQDLSFITVRLTDASKRFAPRAQQSDLFHD